MLMMAVSKRGWRGSAPTFVAAPEPFQSWRRMGEGAVLRNGIVGLTLRTSFIFLGRRSTAHGVWRQIVQAIGLLAAWRFRHP